MCVSLSLSASVSVSVCVCLHRFTWRLRVRLGLCLCVSLHASTFMSLTYTALPGVCVSVWVCVSVSVHASMFVSLTQRNSAQTLNLKLNNPKPEAKHELGRPNPSTPGAKTLSLCPKP